MKAFSLSLMTAAQLMAVAFAQDSFTKLAHFKYGDETAAREIFDRLQGADAAQRGLLEDGLIGVVRSPSATAEGKMFACRMLCLIGTDRCVPAVAPLLLDQELSHPARLALEPIQSAASCKALREALSKADPKLKPGIIGSLAASRDSEALSQIAQLASSTDREIAAAAIRALGKIGSDVAASALLRLKPEPAVEREYHHALIDCLSSTQGGLTDALCARVLDSNDTQSQAALLPAFGSPERAASLTLEWLKGADPTLRQGALSLLAAKHTPDKIVEDTAAKLPELEPAVQAAVLVAFGAGGNAKALPCVKDLLNNPALSAAALEAASKLGDEETVDMLLLLEDPTDTLVTMTGEHVDRRLTDALSDKSLRTKAATALAKRRSRSAVPAFLKILSQDDSQARALAWRALGEIAPANQVSAIWSLSQQLTDNKEKQLAFSALKSICTKAPDRKAVFEVVATFYATAPEEVKSTILDLAVASATPSALKIATEALNSGNPNLRSQAIRALASWANVSAAPILLELSQNGTTNSERILALRGYIRLAGSETTKKLAGIQESDLTQEKQIAMFEKAAQLVTREEEKVLLLASMRFAQSETVLPVIHPFLMGENPRQEAEIAAIAILERNCRSKNPALIEMAQLLAKSRNEAISKKARQIIEDAQKK